MFSLPSDGPTVRSSTISIGAASAPARISSAMSFASRVFIRPLIWTRPPPISSRITGAVITSALPFSTSTIAIRLPTFSRVTSLKMRRAGAVEAHVHGRLVVALVEAGLRVVDPVAGQHDLPPHEDRPAAALGEEIAAERHAAGERRFERARARR